MRDLMKATYELDTALRQTMDGIRKCGRLAMQVYEIMGETLDKTPEREMEVCMGELQWMQDDLEGVVHYDLNLCFNGICRTSTYLQARLDQQARENTLLNSRK